MENKLLLAPLAACLILGCATPGLAQPQRHAYETPAGVELAVTTGEVVYVAGSYALSDALTLAQDVSSTMPGSMRIPFGFSIKAGTYLQSRADVVWTGFCAPIYVASASFPGLGSVVSEGDCIGVRRRNADGALQWVVDNSVHNGMRTVWSRSVRDKEAELLSFSKTERLAGAEIDKVVTFDGYYGGLLNFTFTEGARRREMKFDYDGRSEKMIGMLGKRMLVLKADSVELRYRWVGPPAQ
jgi:hypothetical protein